MENRCVHLVDRKIHGSWGPTAGEHLNLATGGRRKGPWAILDFLKCLKELLKKAKQRKNGNLQVKRGNNLGMFTGGSLEQASAGVLASVVGTSDESEGKKERWGCKGQKRVSGKACK